MTEWISIKKALPLDNSYVKVKFSILFSVEKESLFLKRYFCHRGENITNWVRYWMPLPEAPK